jgi:cytidine deaminase
MDAGNEFRQLAKRGDAVGLLGVSKLREIRGEASGEENKPISRTAYIFYSLKRREEIRTLRSTYGSSFFVVSIFAPRYQRLKTLCERISRSHGSYSPDEFEPEANDLIERDRKEIGINLGQDVEGTFPEADLFLDGRDQAELGRQIARFVELLFGHPYITPTVDEFGMFHAKAASLRTADLSRQVGAVITNSEGEILSTGCNEVPRAGGGANWESVAGTEKDYRDFEVGYDATSKMKHEILVEIFERISG